MSLANIIQALGGASQGVMQGTQARQQMDEQEQRLKQMKSDEDFREFQRSQAIAQAARDNALRTDLAGAAVPVSMQETGGKPATMDNSDVGQPGEAPVAPRMFQVGDKSFGDQGQAQHAVEQANSPTGQAQRISAAYLKNGQAGMALQAQRDAQQAELAQLGLDEKHREIADKMFDQKLGQQSSHEALANFVSAAPGDGQGGSLKVKAVMSKDGKSVTYNRVGDDGSLTPLSDHTYANTPDGVEKAQLWLSRTTPLKDKLANIQQEVKNALEERKTNAEIAEMGARGDYYRKMGDAAGVRADKTGAGKPSLFDHMDEYDRLDLQATQKQVEKLQDTIDSGIANGTLQEGTPAFKQLENRRIALELKGQGILKKYTSDQPAADPLGLRGGGGAQPQPAAPAAPAQPGMAAAAAAAAPAPEPAPILAPGKPDAFLAQRDEQGMTVLRGLDAMRRQAGAAVRAAGARGDAAGMQRAAAAMQDADTKMRQFAEEKWGNGAQRYLSSLEQ